MVCDLFSPETWLHINIKRIMIRMQVRRPRERMFTSGCPSDASLFLLKFFDTKTGIKQLTIELNAWNQLMRRESSSRPSRSSLCLTWLQASCCPSSSQEVGWRRKWSRRREAVCKYTSTREDVTFMNDVWFFLSSCFTSHSSVKEL